MDDDGFKGMQLEIRRIQDRLHETTDRIAYVTFLKEQFENLEKQFVDIKKSQEQIIPQLTILTLQLTSLSENIKGQKATTKWAIGIAAAITCTFTTIITTVCVRFFFK